MMQRTANTIMRGTRVSRSTAYRDLAEFEEENSPERPKTQVRTKKKRTSKLEKVIRKAKERKHI